MYFLSDRYFIEQPILFYNLNRSWEQIPGSSATIGYDYSGNFNGGYICEENDSSTNSLKKDRERP
ncbi:hypothetical protein CTE07_53650 [Chitinophaga terrae (ex Kim and Jung 2007)]|nr:hypothetical protein CTE07_53650 [Chitinophaga terrae (ex Kim and Jung 2007)]